MEDLSKYTGYSDDLDAFYTTYSGLFQHGFQGDKHTDKLND